MPNCTVNAHGRGDWGQERDSINFFSRIIRTFQINSLLFTGHFCPLHIKKLISLLYWIEELKPATSQLYCRWVFEGVFETPTNTQRHIIQKGNFPAKLVIRLPGSISISDLNPNLHRYNPYMFACMSSLEMFRFEQDKIMKRGRRWFSFSVYWIGLDSDHSRGCYGRCALCDSCFRSPKSLREALREA